MPNISLVSWGARVISGVTPVLRGSGPFPRSRRSTRSRTGQFMRNAGSDVVSRKNAYATPDARDDSLTLEGVLPAVFRKSVRASGAEVAAPRMKDRARTTVDPRRVKGPLYCLLDAVGSLPSVV